ncbi:hypothetical protein OG914_11675 [Streptomyces sp. NBC_00291]|uniref:hypothetical protein n=1 Tax=Streptomyces sp. NBC_00291 TaxID=2975704 RepID=UPI00224F14B3|nr:hypothetical protein [Streptomyces sp. NBC_00291]MCX5154644.1 hypothetical protein [Streptomyces sp. NBC_00291]
MDTNCTARLLPWTSPEGKPCYLVGDGTGPVSRLADRMEMEQLAMAADLLDEAQCVLAELKWTPGELHLLAVQLTESLGAVHRVAESRGARLPAPDYAPYEDDFPRHLPTGERRAD